MGSQSQSVINDRAIAKTNAKAKEESKKKLNDALAAYDKRLRLLQTQFDTQKKAINTINIQNKQMLKAIDKIASATPNITAFNQGLEAMQKMNPSDQINNMMEKFQQNWKHELDRAISAFREITEKRTEEEYELEEDIEDKDWEDEEDGKIKMTNQLLITRYRITWTIHRMNVWIQRRQAWPQQWWALPDTTITEQDQITLESLL